MKDYVIKCRFFVSEQGWKVERVPFTGTLEAAGRETARYARALDSTYPDDVTWTVDLTGPNGSYYQLFHGRLS
jgi:hypothetical protein